MKLKPLCKYYTAMITKLCAFISLLQALEEEWSHYQQLREATLAFYNWGTQKHTAVMEFLQSAEKTSWTQQPYPSYKIFHIVYNLNSKEHAWHLRQGEIYCSCIKLQSQVKWPNLSTQVSSIILRSGGLDTSLAIFSYLSYTSYFNWKPFLGDFHVILGMFCVEDLYKDTAPTPAKHALPNILLSHSSLVVHLLQYDVVDILSEKPLFAFSFCSSGSLEISK